MNSKTTSTLSTSHSTRTLNYRPDIDGLRAVAVLMVLTFHFALLPKVSGGFLGVDVFFVISGYLITAIVTQQLDTGTFTFTAFYVNRIRRLAPGLFALLLGVMVAGALCLFPSDFEDLSKQILAAQFYVANIYYWRNVNYFGLNAQDLLLLHTWSLAAEEQFYLCFPALLLVLHRRIRHHLWLALVVLMLASFCLNIFFVVRKPEAAFYLFPTRAWELLVGALLPALSVRWPRPAAVDQVLGLAGAGLLLVALTCYQVNFAIPGYYALIPTIGAACVILSAIQAPTVVSRCLGLRPVVYLGAISYSLYLVHWPVNVLARELIPDYSLPMRWVMFGISIILASLIYHLVENPVRLRRAVPTRRPLMIVYSLGLLVTLTGYVIVNFTRGLPERFSPEVVRLASYVNDRPEPLTECEFAAQPVAVLAKCQLGAVGREPTWLIYGDSHAWAAHAAFDQWLRQNNQNGLLVFRHACPPLTGIHFPGKDECFQFNVAVTDFIERHANFEHIVLVSTWKWPVDGGLITESHALLTPQESCELFTNRFVDTIHHLNDLHREVYVWEPVPGARMSVPVALARAAWHQAPADLEVGLEEYRSSNKLFFEALSKSRQWVTASYSPSRVLCQTGKCMVEADGMPLYADNGHITNSSVTTWIQVLQQIDIKK